MLSLITSWLGFFYLLLFKAVVWMASTREEIKKVADHAVPVPAETNPAHEGLTKNLATRPASMAV